MLKKFILAMICSFSLAHAVVNIEPQRIGDKDPGFSGNLNIGMERSSGNTNKESFSGGGTIQYDQTEYLTFFKMNYEYGEADDVRNTNNIFAHYRYIRHLKGMFDWEAFTQLESNEFTATNIRALGGLDIRADLLRKNKSVKLFLATGFYYEYLKPDAGFGPIEHNVRNSTYLNASKKFKYTTITYNIYYMPKVDDISDFYVRQAFQSKTLMAENLWISWTILSEYDSKPLPTIKKSDLNSQIGILYKF